MIAQITAKHFCAGIVFDEIGYVIEAAPIVKYMKGWDFLEVEFYCDKKGWKFAYHE